MIRVLVVDDSLLMRALLTEILGSAPDIKVIGSAPDPIAAREMIKELNPDVLTLDVEMPRMDGLEFLSRLMRLRPMPVVMISSLTEKGSEVTLRALELGAVDYVSKPPADRAGELQHYAEEIQEKVRNAANAHVRATPVAAVRPSPAVGAGLSQRFMNSHLIAIGASTGGTNAIKDVLSALPADLPPIVMVQHMPETFTHSFARRLDSLSSLTVLEAQGGERLQPGYAYLAPGHSHLLLKKSGAGHVLELSQSAPVNRHRPAVDVTFRSAAELFGRNATAILLTGMGKDGAQGMLEMRNAGAWTIGQDQESCVVYGMPREAALIGAVQEVSALQDVPARLLARLRKLSRDMG